jgi:hypothetical protein
MSTYGALHPTRQVRLITRFTRLFRWRVGIVIIAAVVGGVLMAGCSSGKTPTEMTLPQASWCAGHIKEAQAAADEQKTGVDVLRLYAPVVGSPGTLDKIRKNPSLTKACLAVLRGRDATVEIVNDEHTTTTTT